VPLALLDTLDEQVSLARLVSLVRLEQRALLDTLEQLEELVRLEQLEELVLPVAQVLLVQQE